MKKKETGFLTDFKQVQVISGLAATSGALMTLAVLFFVPISASARNNVILISLATLAFNAIYYLVPAFYLNKKTAFIPDLVYITAITLVMRNLGQYGSVYFPFYMILAAVDAFIFPLFQYAVIVFGMIVGIFLSVQDPMILASSPYIVEIYGLLVLAIVLHIISREALKERLKKEGLEAEIEVLENDKRQIRILLESISDGMFVVNAGNKITFYNPAALSILNIVAPEDKILGRDINDFMPTLGPGGPEPITREVFANYKPKIRNDFRLVRSDLVMKLHTNITPVVLEKGQLEGAIIFFRDITKEKHLEEQRAEFNAVASHEIRSPLSVIEGYLYFLLDKDSGAKYDNVTKEFIEKAHRASQDLIHLVGDILTVIRADEGELEVTLEKIDLKTLVESVVEGHKKDAEEKKIKLEFKLLTKRIIPEILTDPVKVREVASNLIGNAIKFTERGGVTVELGLLQSEALVNVIDSGIGIDESDQKMIFQKFYRAEDWKTRKTSGTGLGLYISKTLIGRIGGKIGVQAEKNKGSRFYFTIPLAYPNEEDIKNQKAAKA